MAKRKSLLSDKLNSKKAPGWRDMISQPVQSQPEPEQPTVPTKKPTPVYKRKTYLMTPELIERVNNLADKESLGINELVRYLLELGVDMVEQGTHVIPTQPGKRRIR